MTEMLGQQNRLVNLTEHYLCNTVRMSLHIRVKKAIDYAGLKPARVAARLKVSRSTVSDWLSGKTDEIKGRNLLALAELTGVKIKWLQTGKGAMTEEEGTQIAESDHGAYSTSNGIELRRVPVISSEQAINLKDDPKGFTPSEDQEWQNCSSKVTSKQYGLTVSGDAMVSPVGRSLPSGSIAVIDPEREAVNGNIVAAHKNGHNTVLIKQLVIDGDNRYLKSFDTQYALIPMADDYVILGVVTERIHSDDMIAD